MDFNNLIDFVNTYYQVILLVFLIIFYEYRLYSYTNKKDINSTVEIINFKRKSNTNFRELQTSCTSKFSEFKEVLIKVFKILNTHKDHIRRLEDKYNETANLIGEKICNIESKMDELNGKLDHVNLKMDGIIYLINNISDKIREVKTSELNVNDINLMKLKINELKRIVKRLNTSIDNKNLDIVFLLYSFGILYYESKTKSWKNISDNMYILKSMTLDRDIIENINAINRNFNSEYIKELNNKIIKKLMMN